MKATAIIYLDTRANAEGLHNVKIRVMHNGKRRFYGTTINMVPTDFDKMMKRQQGKNYVVLTALLAKANKIIKDLEVFTAEKFKEAFYENRNTTKSVTYAFEKYIKDLKLESRLSTAESYQYAINSLKAFNKNKDFEFADVTPRFLKRYEKWMLDNKRSITTVGIYLRNLRAILNIQELHPSLYPFGKRKYVIPTSKNTKKALTLQQIQQIYHYEADPNSYEEMARDYWMFLYLAGGMNMKDFCFLKWDNIGDEFITYVREKTKSTNSEQATITVAMKPQTQAIINKWGVRSLSKDAYVFPHLNHKMNEVEKRKTYKQLTKVVNDNMKRIAKKLEIDRNVTTYYARHSFATVLKRSGVQTEMISELLGHSDLKVTRNYLDGFENEQIQKETDALTIGLDKAK